MLVKKIMTTNVDTVSTSSSFKSIQETFEREVYHHLLVEEDGLLLGVISDRDIMKYISNRIKANQLDVPELLSAKDVMTTNIISVDQETPINTASILLLENNISCLPVVSSDYHIEGILTWKDIVRFHIYNT